MSIGTILIILGVPAFLAFSFWSYYQVKLTEVKEKLKVKEESAKWLEEQKLLPRYKFLVKTRSGTIIENETPFEPTSETEYWAILGWCVTQRTSLERVNIQIEGFIKRGVVHDLKTNTYIPMCEIEYMQAKECP